MLESITQFDKKFRSLEAKTGDDLEAWYARNTGRRCAVASVGTKMVGLAGTFSEARTGQIKLTTLFWGAEMQSVLQTGGDSICISVPLDGRSQVTDPHFGKLSCVADQARIFRLDAGVTVNSSPGYSRLNITMPVDLLETRARSYYDTELNDPLLFDPLIDLSRMENLPIKTLISYMLRRAVHFSDTSDNPLVETSFTEMIISSVLETLPHSYCKTGIAATDGAVPMIIRRAEEFMRAHAAEPITVETIARHAGCSERALQNGFRSFHGKSPITRLREIRLTYARADIEREDDTITAIAYKWGFSNLGRFAAQYADRFGERPCQTLGVK